MRKTFCKKELRKTTTAKNQETKQQLVPSFPILVPWEQFKVRAVSSAFFLDIRNQVGLKIVIGSLLRHWQIYLICRRLTDYICFFVSKFY